MADARSPVQRPVARMIARLLNLGVTLSLLGLYLIAAYSSSDSAPLWTKFAWPAAGLLFLASWLLPFLSPPDGTPPLSLRRRMILGALGLLIVAIFAGQTYLVEVRHVSPRDLAIAFPAIILLYGATALVLPRDPEASIDMRPVWVICALIFALLSYFIFSQ